MKEKTVIVASKNPVKIEATSIAFKMMFPNQVFQITGQSIPSNVSDQPLTSAETFDGAKNRAWNAKKKYEDADFWVGIEGGIEKKGQDMEVFAWVYILTDSGYGKSKTANFYLPPRIIELIDSGKELGEADDIVFGKSNSKQKQGAVGLLTGNLIDRKNYYRNAIIFALIPFRNKKLYF